MEKITSRTNPKIKYACSLKKSNVSKAEKKVLCEGLRLCEDIAENGVFIETAFITESAFDAGKCGNIIGKSKYTYIIDEAVADKLSDTKTAQGIFVVCTLPETQSEVSPSGKYIFLENVSDPGNLGTIIRTAEAFGLSGAVLSGTCNPFSSKAVRASMGAVFRFPIIEAEDKISFIENAIKNGMKFYCAVVDSSADDVSRIKGESGAIAAVGNEANGLSEELVALGESVTIHMSGRAESLNASQAATVLMYELSK